jgi:hypothetical protein
MAGTQAGFDEKAFRDAVTFVQTMALPAVAAEQPTFYFQVDPELGFDPTAATQTNRTSVRVPCAVEYLDAQGLPSNFGILTPANLKVTVLDSYYEQVRGCHSVVIGEDRYFYRRTEPPSGLFGVTLYVLHFAAENET